MENITTGWWKVMQHLAEENDICLNGKEKWFKIHTMNCVVSKFQALQKGVFFPFCFLSFLKIKQNSK